MTIFSIVSIIIGHFCNIRVYINLIVEHCLKCRLKIGLVFCNYIHLLLRRWLLELVPMELIAVVNIVGLVQVQVDNVVEEQVLVDSVVVVPMENEKVLFFSKLTAYLNLTTLDVLTMADTNNN